MIHQDLEIYNIEEMLEGDGSVIVPPEKLAAFAERNVPTAGFEKMVADGWWLTRVPNKLRLQLNPYAITNAVQATGAELRFNLVSERARFVLKCKGASSIAEVYQGSFLVGWQVVGPTATEVVVTPPCNLDKLIQLTEQHGLPFDAHLSRVILPWQQAVRLIEMEGEFEPPQRKQVPSKRYLAYGSSITQGSTAVRPTGMYAQRTAQASRSRSDQSRFRRRCTPRAPDGGLYRSAPGLGLRNVGNGCQCGIFWRGKI